MYIEIMNVVKRKKREKKKKREENVHILTQLDDVLQA